MKLVTLVCAALLAGCATYSNVLPVPVEGQADTAKFQVFLANHATDSAADQAAAEDFAAYKAKNGYSGHSVLARKFVAFPTHIEYIVRFTR